MEPAWRNVGNPDRAGRAVSGVVLVLFALFCPFAASLGAAVVWGSGLVGAVLVLTALVRFCPLYRLPGLHS